MNSLNVWNGAGRRIYINEVGTRDGLQMEAAFVPTEDKIALINALSQAGLSKIEVTAFVSPKAIPALRDGEIVMREIERQPGTIYTALVPNVRGAERAIDAHTDELNLVMSVSETHNLCNLRMQRSQSFEALKQVIAVAQQAATPVNVSLSCCFGCPMEGDVPEAEVLGWVQRFADLGVQGITLCDTTGMAYPSQVLAMVQAADHPDAEAVLVPDTAMHTMDFIDQLESAVGKTVLTANQVTVWKGLQLIGPVPPLPGLGRLFGARP